jgi:ATP-binding cassette, subfamily B, bacterial
MPFFVVCYNLYYKSSTEVGNCSAVCPAFNAMFSFRDLLGYFRNYWRVAIFSIVASSFFELLDLVVPYAIGQILNVLSDHTIDKPIQILGLSVANLTHFPNNSSLSLGILLGLVFLVTVVRAPVQPWFANWFHWLITMAARRDRSGEVIAKILSLPLAFYEENNPGRIAGRVARGLTNYTWTYPEIAGQLIPKLVRISGIFIVLWVIETRIAIAFLVSFVLILGYTIKSLKSIIRQEEAVEKYMENTESRTSEIITNIKTVKAFASEASELKRQKQRLNREYQVIIHRIHRNYIHLEMWQRLVIQLSMFGVLIATLSATIADRISLGYFVTALTVASMAYAELEPISALAEVLARRYASMVRFHQFMQQPEGTDTANLFSTSSLVNPYEFTGKIQFEGVSFGYDRDRPVLQDLTFLIEPYQTVAIVGRSGSGKSTLVKLLFRYFEPTDGRILIDGENIKTLDVTQYRRRLAIVHQEVDVFNGTLLDNLTYGNPQASFSQVETACKIARVDQFVADLPNGYYTVVGERGMRLSGGQRQRLGIARSLIIDPDVLVFDEATSSLDYESERSIQLAMKSVFGTRTTIIIAHRLSTVREADKIVVLDTGKIVEVGSHDELLTQKGLYHRLHTLSESGELVD